MSKEHHLSTERDRRRDSDRGYDSPDDGIPLPPDEDPPPPVQEPPVDEDPPIDEGPKGPKQIVIDIR